MTIDKKRRELLKLTGIAGVVFSSGLAGQIGRVSAADDFYFVQFTDTHYGFKKKKINPDPDLGFMKAIDKVNKLKHKPDFIMFTGDLTHSVDDPGERLKRLKKFRKLVDRLEVKNLRFIPGEHDASLDNGDAYRQVFGETYYTFYHKGVNFIALDNVSNPRGILGETQLEWLQTKLASLDKQQPLVIFAHRPLFDLYPKWGWSTGDGSRALEQLGAFKYVSVFYGHIHQEHQHLTGHIKHFSARSLIFPLPAPGSTAKRKPIPWDTAHPYRGLGPRYIELYPENPEIEELDIS